MLGNSTYSSSKENFYPTGTTFGHKPARDYSLHSLAKRNQRLHSLIKDQIEANQETIEHLQSQLQKEVELSSCHIQKQSQALQLLHNEILDRCKKQNCETSQQDREVLSECEGRKIKPLINTAKDANTRQADQLKKTKEKLETKLTGMNESFAQAKRDSQEMMYLLLGQCQSQMETIESRISELQRISTCCLDQLESKAHDLSNRLESSINKQQLRGKKDEQLIENLIEKLIHKMTAL